MWRARRRLELTRAFTALLVSLGIQEAAVVPPPLPRHTPVTLASASAVSFWVTVGKMQKMVVGSTEGRLPPAE